MNNLPHYNLHRKNFKLSSSNPKIEPCHFIQAANVSILFKKQLQQPPKWQQSRSRIQQGRNLEMWLPVPDECDKRRVDSILKKECIENTEEILPGVAANAVLLLVFHHMRNIYALTLTSSTKRQQVTPTNSARRRQLASTASSGLTTSFTILGAPTSSLTNPPLLVNATSTIPNSRRKHL